MIWTDAIDRWGRTLAAAHKPETTRYLRRYQLGRLAIAMQPTAPFDVDGQQLVDWIGSQGWGRETLRSYRAAVRGFYTWAHASGMIATNPALALPSVTPSTPMPKPAPEDAYRLALAAADERVRLMVRLAAELGLRRGEVCKVHVDHLERDLLGWSLRVRGKGDKVRRVPLSDSFAATIRRACGNDYAFPGRIDGHLSPAYVGKLVSRVLPEAWAMHSLRHRFATLAYAHDRDVFTVQELLGHASPVTTRRYVLVPDDSLRRTVLAVARAS